MTQHTEEKWMEVYRVQTAAIERLEQQNAELLAACISAKSTMLASIDNSYAMADTIEYLESVIAKAGVK